MRPYRRLFDTALVHSDAELAHRAAFGAIRAAGPVLRLGRTHPRPGGPGAAALGREVTGLLGLAAGFDKNAEGIDALAALGFGFVEVGTVTGQPQPGNPRPRLFRLPADGAVVNRMGFNNDGAEAVAARLAARAERHRRRPPASAPVLGINLGRTKAVPEDDEEAVIADYAKSTRLLTPHADYLVVNVSSPNTPGLRDLQRAERLEPLLARVRATADAAADGRRVPLLVKIAPDLSNEEVLAVADLALALPLDGIVATNTTLSRTGLRSAPADLTRVGEGGLSGRPVRERATEVIALLRGHVGPRLTLIGVGGLRTLADARERLDAGADLLQAYTGFVYEGPRWPSRINHGLRDRLGHDDARAAPGGTR